MIRKPKAAGRAIEPIFFMWFDDGIVDFNKISGNTTKLHEQRKLHESFDT